MPLLPENFRLSRDPKRLLKEVDAAIRIKDIEKVHRYRGQLELQWWESGFMLLLFISGLGFIITIYKLIPSQNSLLFWFVFFWFVLFVGTMLAIIEFLLAKINALRCLYEMESHTVEQMEKKLAGLTQELSERSEA